MTAERYKAAVAEIWQLEGDMITLEHALSSLHFLKLERDEYLRSQGAEG